MTADTINGCQEKLKAVMTTGSFDNSSSRPICCIWGMLFYEGEWVQLQLKKNYVLGHCLIDAALLGLQDREMSLIDHFVWLLDFLKGCWLLDWLNGGLIDWQTDWLPVVHTTGLID